jgi:hypothetical protein
MREQEIKKRLDAEPFKPFVLHISDQGQYEVRDPSMVFVTHTTIIIGLDPDEGGIPQDSILVDPIHVTRLTPLKSNGHKRRK